MNNLDELSSIVISFINEGNLKTYDFIKKNIPELIWVAFKVSCIY